jgi:hypothetical protein
MADKDTVKNAYMSLFPESMKTKADEIIEAISKHGIELQYFETDSKFDGGGKVVSRNDIKQYIDLISKKTDN